MASVVSVARMGENAIGDLDPMEAWSSNEGRWAGNPNTNTMDACSGTGTGGNTVGDGHIDAGCEQ